jgi:hypothetical protein
MPLHLIEGHFAAGRLKRLPIKDPAVLPGAIPIYAAHQRNHPLGIAAKFLLSQLQSGIHRPKSGSAARAVADVCF